MLSMIREARLKMCRWFGWHDWVRRGLHNDPDVAAGGPAKKPGLTFVHHCGLWLPRDGWECMYCETGGEYVYTPKGWRLEPAGKQPA